MPATRGEVLDALGQRIQQAGWTVRRDGGLDVGAALAGQGPKNATQRCGIGQGADERSDQVDWGVAVEAGTPDQVLGIVTERRRDESIGRSRGG